MIKRFKNLKGKTLLIHLILTAAYPAAKAYVTEGNRLLVFCDVLTIVGMILLVAGVVYGLAIRGDFDLAGFTFRRGLRSQNAAPVTYDTYKKNLKEKREDAFNYPLFLGLVYLAVSAFIAYALL